MKKTCGNCDNFGIDQKAKCCICILDGLWRDNFCKGCDKWEKWDSYSKKKKIFLRK